MADLTRLLGELAPRRRPGRFAFCEVKGNREPGLARAAVAVFREAEGTTLVLPAEAADAAGLAYERVWAWIELSVHSELTDVGLLAAVCGRLAGAGLCVNAFSALHHDHLFVLEEEAERALAVLREADGSGPPRGGSAGPSGARRDTPAATADA